MRRIFTRRTIKACLVVLCNTLLLINFIPALPAQAANASLYFSPAAGTYVIGSNFSVGIKVNTGGDVINSAEGSVSFDTNLLEVVSISKGGSIFPFWTAEPSFSNANGSISFGGGLPPPAFNGTAGHVCTVTFKAKKSGGAAVRFTSGAVLAHDGKGTNVLASMGSAKYVISPKVEAPQEPSKPAPEPQAPSEPTSEPDYNLPDIKSSTHPDPNAWYNTNNVKFSWELPAGVSGVSVAFDQDPRTDPGSVADGDFSNQEYKDVEDGVWYFHIKFKDSRRWGTINHFRVMIDTRPPDPFAAEVKYIDIGEWPEIHFKTEDKDSGLKHYEIIIGSLEEEARIVEPEINFIKANDLEAGEHTAMIKAIDNAGNEAYSVVKFKIEPIEAPKILNYSREIKASDNFYINGSSFPEATVMIYIGDKNEIIATSSIGADSAGNWFYLYDKNLANGRYFSWAIAVNHNGIKSGMSEKVSFLVSPPVFAVVGDFVINYFTVFVSLLFMVILVILAILWIIGLIRKHLRKETFEIEQVLKKNLGSLNKEITGDFDELAQYEGKSGYKKAKAATEARVKKRIELAEKKILKEVRDVEEILK